MSRLLDRIETGALWVLPFVAADLVVFGDPRIALCLVACWFLLRRARDAEAALRVERTRRWAGLR